MSAAFYCRRRREAYRSWHLLGGLTQPISREGEGGRRQCNYRSAEGTRAVVGAAVTLQVQRDEKLSLRLAALFCFEAPQMA